MTAGPADNGHGDPRRRVTFTIAVIALGAKMARADGEVTRDEVAAFNEVFQVPPGEEAHMRTIFDLARRSTHGFESYARQVGRLFADDRAVLEDLLGGLFHIALADGEVCAAEDAYLREVARLFGFSAADYARIRATHAGPPPEEDPHTILGVAAGASPGRNPRRLSPAGARAPSRRADLARAAARDHGARHRPGRADQRRARPPDESAGSAAHDP